MKKESKILCLILAALLLAGCGGAAVEPEATAQTSPSERQEETEETQTQMAQQTENTKETEIAQVLPADATAQAEKIQLDVVVGEYSQDSIQWWQDFEAQFEEENPDVDLTIDVVSWFDMDTTVDALIEQDCAPDILNATTATCRSYLGEGLLLPADTYLSDETRARIYPRLLDGCEEDETAWSLPIVCIPWIMIYNPEILDAAGVSVPSDWEELESACKTIKHTMPDVIPWGVDLLNEDCFVLYALNNGGGLVGDDGEWFINSDENLEAINFLIGMINSGLTNNASEMADWSALLQDMFMQEKMAMMVIPMSGLALWEYDECTVPYGIARIPANTGDESTSLATVDYFTCFDKGQSPEELDAIRRFYDFFYEEERHMHYAYTEILFPVTAGAARLMGQTEPDMVLLDQILTSAYTHPHLKDGWVDVWWNLKDYMWKVLEEGENPARLLDEMQYEATGR